MPCIAWDKQKYKCLNWITFLQYRSNIYICSIQYAKLVAKGSLLGWRHPPFAERSSFCKVSPATLYSCGYINGLSFTDVPLGKVQSPLHKRLHSEVCYWFAAPNNIVQYPSSVCLTV